MDVTVGVAVAGRVALAVGVPLGVDVAVPVGVGVAPGVTVGVAVSVGVAVGAGASVVVGVGVAVRVMVGVTVAVPVAVGVRVEVAVGVAVAVRVAVGAGTAVVVWVGVAVRVTVGVPVAVPVAVGVRVVVVVGVAVAVRVAVGAGTAVVVWVGVAVRVTVGVPVAVPVAVGVRVEVVVGVAEAVGEAVGVEEVVEVTVVADVGVDVPLLVTWRFTCQSPCTGLQITTVSGATGRAVHRDGFGSCCPAVDGEVEDVSKHGAFVPGRRWVIAVARHDPVHAREGHPECAALHPLRVEDGDFGPHRYRRAQVGAGRAVEVHPGVGGRDVAAAHRAGTSQANQEAHQDQQDGAKPFPSSSHGFHASPLCLRVLQPRPRRSTRKKPVASSPIRPGRRSVHTISGPCVLARR